MFPLISEVFSEVFSVVFSDKRVFSELFFRSVFGIKECFGCLKLSVCFGHVFRSDFGSVFGLKSVFASVFG